MKRLLVFGFLLGLVAGHAATLRWAGDSEGGAPYVFQNPKNPQEIIGFEVEVMQAVASRMGREAVFVQNQFDGLIPGLARGDYDVAVNGLEITEERRREVLFTEPYYVTAQQWTVRRGEPGVRALSAAPGKTVGTLKAALSQRLLEQAGGVTVRAYDGQINAYEDLALGRLDAVYMDYPIALYYGKTNRKLELVGAPEGRLEYGMALDRRNVALGEELNRSLRALKADGTLRRIYERWGLWTPELAREWNDTIPATSLAAAYESYAQTFQATRSWSERVKQYVGYLPLLLTGALTTLVLSFISMLLAAAWGLGFALVRAYGPGWARNGVVFYVELVRGTPLLIQLFIIFYGLPHVGIQLSPFVAAVLGLALNYSAYEAENYRAGFASVPHGQREAASVLGLSRAQALRYVILPQAYRVVLPPMTNDFISLLKDSSLVSVITMVELTKVYGQLASTYYDYLGIGVMTATIYLLLGLPFVALARWIEHRLRH